MKKIFVFIALALFALLSCNKENALPDAVPAQISFKLLANHPEGTKAVKSGWEAGDAIFVFFDNVAAPKYLKMNYDGSSWSYTEMDGDSAGSLGLSNGDTGIMRAVFLPFGSSLGVTADGTGFKFSEIQYSYYLTATLAYTVEGNTVSGSFDMAVPDGFVQFFFDNPLASDGVASLREAHVHPVGIKSISAAGEIMQKDLGGGELLPGYAYQGGFLFSGVLQGGAPGVQTEYNFVLDDGAAKKRAYAYKTMNDTGSSGRAANITGLQWMADMEMVDLGLPSGTLWASVNLGAETYYNWYGDYFAWGETSQRREPHTWANYLWGNGTDDFKGITKYIIDDGYVYAGAIDGKTQLDPQDDPATAILGEGYSTPTAEDWLELWSGAYVTFTWTSVTAPNPDFPDCFPKLTSRVYGFRVRSRSNYNSIFLPATGRWISDTGGVTSRGKDGSTCYYWSSTLYAFPNSYPRTYEAYCFNESKSLFYYDATVQDPTSDVALSLNSMPHQGRLYGLTVRPVKHQ